ncbi:MAG: amino acid adenylation domain-containing protein, partial [bacterium]|nr:amino acid adenylation domain-containing protein [bacterium]
LEAFENQEYQFEDLLEHLEIERDVGRSPLFDIVFTLQNLEAEDIKIKGLTFKPYEFENKISKFDITMQILEGETTLFTRLGYCVKLFKKETMERLASHFVNILKEAVINPSIMLGKINMLSEAEEKQLLYEFNDTQADYPQEKTIHHLFEEQVERTPDSIAVVGRGKTGDTGRGVMQITYRRLSEKSNQLAGPLREKGVETDAIVGIMAGRSIEMIIGIMGILNAGGAYLPIDPSYPGARKQFMLEDCGTAILLTTPSLVKEIIFHKEIMYFDNAMAPDLQPPASDSRQSASSLAYVIYTSGSTGNPKGNLTSHRNVVNVVRAPKYVDIREQDRILQLSNYAFDGSVFDIFGALLNGAVLVMLPGSHGAMLGNLAKSIIDEKITVFFLTTALFNTLVDLELQCLRYTRKILFGGERVSVTHAEKALQYLAKNRIIHVYGPTEATVFSTYYFINEIAEKVVTVPIGKPIANDVVYIIDKTNGPVPIGVPGEIIVGGDGIARGYLNRPELTHEKFNCNFWDYRGVRNKGKQFVGNPRIYKTGDLAKWLPDGNIEFLGRIDHQVKIRGFRIELGEIENSLLSNDSIKETIVLAKKDKRNNNYLVAYYVQNYVQNETETNGRRASISIPELQDFLAEKLPDYMIPSYFVPLEKLPLTANGKIDIKALPESSVKTGTDTRYEAPHTPGEKKLVNIWQEVLDTKPIGIHDSFFELGGDSIKAIQVAAQVQKYGLRMEIKDLFQHLTINRLGPFLKDKLIKVQQETVSGDVKPTPIQKWFFNRNFTDKHHWNQSVMLYKKDGFDEEIVRSVMEAIVRHHDALRMSYPAAEGKSDIGMGIRQYNRAVEGDLFGFSVYDFRAGTETGNKNLEKRIEKEAGLVQASIDLSTGPLVKTALFKTLQGGDHLLLAIHHLVVDGVSWRILLEDFAAAYKQMMDGQSIRIPYKTTSFKEWSQTLSQYAENTDTQWFAKEMEYWQKLENNETTPLPVDRSGETGKASKLKNYENVTVSFTKKETETLLKNVNHAYNTEINDTLLTALGRAVSRWTGKNKVLINLEGHGRETLFDNVDITRTVGWFTSLFPVILTMNDNLSLDIRQTKENLRNIPNKGIGYGILEYLTPKKGMILSGGLNPEISFNYLGQFDRGIGKGLFSLSGFSSGHSVSPDSEMTDKLTINGMLMDGILSLDFTYSKTLYHKETILQLAGSYKENLLAIIEHCRDKKETTLTPGDYWPGILTISQLQEFENAIVPDSGEQKHGIQKLYPLSPMQEGMLFHHIYDKNSSMYFVQFELDIRGPFNRAAFDKSLQVLMQKYDILRTNFTWQGVERPVQWVRKSRHITAYFENISGMEEEEKNIFAKDFARKDRQKGFDLSRDILLRVSILKTGENLFKIFWNMPHIIIDGWCTGILFGDFFNFYDYFRTRAGQDNRSSHSPHLEETYRYIDYIRWLDKQDKKEVLSYWKNYLRDYSGLAALPKTTRQANENRKDFQQEHLSFALDEEV